MKIIKKILTIAVKDCDEQSMESKLDEIFSDFGYTCEIKPATAIRHQMPKGMSGALWSKEDEDFVMAHCDDMTPQEIAKRLNRSKMSVVSKIWHLSNGR